MQRVTRWTALCVAVFVAATGCADDSDDEGSQRTTPALADAKGGPPQGGSGGTVITPPPLEDAGDEAADADANVDGSRVTVALSEVFGDVLSGYDVTYRNQTVTTNQQGEADLSLRANERFALRIEREDQYPHRLVGHAGVAPFRYPAVWGDRQTVRELFSVTGTTPDPQSGLLFVGVQNAELEPLVGASVGLDGASSDVVTFGESTSQADNTINQNETRFVVFSNIRADEVNLDIELPDDASDTTCRLHPAGDADPTIEVPDGDVTIVLFTCS